MRPPHVIRMHAADNVAIVANDGGLPAGTALPGGPVLVDKVPQAHKVALADIPEGGEVRRYNVPIGYAVRPIPAGSWVHERLLRMPEARGLGVGKALTVHALRWAREQGHERAKADWRVANLLASRFWPNRGFRPTAYRMVRYLHPQAR